MRIEKTARGEDGLATLLVIILLVMMTGFTLMNAMALSSLKREMKLIERRQLQAATTNAVALPAPPK